MKKLLMGLSMAFALMTLIACEPATETAEPEVAPPDVSENAMNSDDRTAPSLQAGIAAAKSDLAGRLEITEQDIELSEAREVTWRDGALGCPEPDMMYTQALVPGYYIRLSAGDDSYAYHAGRDGQPFLCPEERSQPPADDHRQLHSE